MTAHILRADATHRKDTVLMRQDELTRLRLIEEAFRLICDMETSEVRALPMREWVDRMQRGRLAAGKAGLLECLGNNRCHLR